MKQFLLPFLGLLLSLFAQAQTVPVPPNYDTLLRLGDGADLYFQYIPAGTFQMGSPKSEAMRGGDEGPLHEVTTEEGFYLGTFEVTQAQWEKIMGSNPAIFRTLDNSPAHPVEYVSWNDCQVFISKLNAMGIGTFRLPTEAEWEYACRAGTTTAYYWGEKMAKNGQSEYTWANSRSFASTNPVGSKKPNPWGLYDMSGNVWEWCQDWFGPYSNQAQTNPEGPETGNMKVFRGGSWYDFYEAHRSANRHKHAPDGQYTAIGLRLLWEGK